MTWIIDPKKRTFRWSIAVIGLTLLVMAINLAVAWRNDVNLRQRGQRNAEDNARQTLATFTDHAVRLIDYGDSHLRAARSVYQRFGASENSREFLAASKVLHSESLIVAATFSDRDGKMVFDSEKRQMPPVTAAGLDYFRYFQTHDRDDPYIAPTRYGRVWKQYLYRIVRRLSRNGQFDGVAILNMRPEHLANFTHQFNLGPNAIYAILTLDHRLIVRQPMAPESAYDEPQDSLELWSHVQTASSGMYATTSPFDGRKRIYFYQTLADYPLVVQVGIDEQDILKDLAEARIPNIYNVATFTIVSCVFCLFVLLILSKSDALNRANATLEQSSARLTQTNANLTRLTNELLELSRTDFLTGLANRRAFIEALDHEFHRSRRFGSPAALLLMDIDHFKLINDTHGHETGDHALVSLANTLKTMARITDMPARFGGEEFVFLLPGSDPSGAMEMAERIRMAVAEIVVRSPSGDFGFTVSIGVTAFDNEDKDSSVSLTRADGAMYQAKVLGRNKVCINKG